MRKANRKSQEAAKNRVLDHVQYPVHIDQETIGKILNWAKGRIKTHIDEVQSVGQGVALVMEASYSPVWKVKMGGKRYSVQAVVFLGEIQILIDEITS